MTSKLFTGDMPELMENILNNLSEDIHTLYSCALVSRFWSKMSIPILWRDPLSLSRRSSFISRYFSYLSEHDNFILNEYGIVTDFPNTLFHYASFLKVFGLFALDTQVELWIEDMNINTQKEDKIVKYDIANLLFKIFIDRGATLSKLDLYMCDDDDEVFEVKPEIFYSLGQNAHFFSQLQDLSVFIKTRPCTQNAIALLRILAENAKKINTLTFTESDSDPQVYHTFACVIKSQEQLKRFSLLGSFGNIVSALRCQQDSLKELILESCFYSTDFNELRNYKNLEVFRMYHCGDTHNILSIVGNCLHKINTLDICSYSINASNILQMLQKSGPLLQRLRLFSEQKEIPSLPLLLETLTSFCPNITYLYFSNIKISTQFLNLIGGLQKLQFLTLQWMDDGSEENMKTCIMQFAETLPSSLEYLDLHKNWNNSSYSHIDVLLNHCNAPLKKLLLKLKYGDKKTTDALIGFCIRKKTLDEVYIYDLFDRDANWCRFKNDLEEYVKLVTFEHIYVDC